MTDIFDKEIRSKIMSRIRGKDTGPEIAINMVLVRNGIHGYRRNYRGLPGNPDFLFEKKKLVLFYNSEFWHCRNPVKISRMNRYWRRKLFGNWLRDIKVNFKLLLMGYRISTIWGDEYKDCEKVL